MPAPNTGALTVEADKVNDTWTYTNSWKGITFAANKFYRNTLYLMGSDIKKITILEDVQQYGHDIYYSEGESWYDALRNHFANIEMNWSTSDQTYDKEYKI